MRALIILIATLALAGCSSNRSINPITWISPHKVEIQQGNYVPAEAIAKLKPGMSRAQVRFLLGSPLLADTFHANRWDYRYTLVTQGKLDESKDKLLTVYFKGDLLERIEGDGQAVQQESALAQSEAKEKK